MFKMIGLWKIITEKECTLLQNYKCFTFDRLFSTYDYLGHTVSNLTYTLKNKDA